MAKPKDNRKKVFTAIAYIVMDRGKKKLQLNSSAHWQMEINKLWPGKKYAITVEEYKPARSKEQLAYYWVLLGYLADYSGHTSEELHDAIMRRKFGTKKIKVGNLEEEVRKSIADTARFPKSDMVELISEALNLCSQLEIRVPTKQELGYLPG